MVPWTKTTDGPGQSLEHTAIDESILIDNINILNDFSH
jgi:hypothetical protein